MWFRLRWRWEENGYYCQNVHISTFIFLSLFKRFYLFTFWEKGREGEREGERHRYVRETSVGCLLHTHNWGPGLQLRHVPWQGLKPATFQFLFELIHWATPARATFLSFLRVSDICLISETLKLSPNGLKNSQFFLSKTLILKMLDTFVETDSV